VLLQKKVKIVKGETPETLAEKVLKLEHTWYSKVIDSLLKPRLRIREHKRELKDLRVVPESTKPCTSFFT